MKEKIQLKQNKTTKKKLPKRQKTTLNKRIELIIIKIKLNLELIQFIIIKIKLLNKINQIQLNIINI